MNHTTWEVFADRFAREIDRPLTTLLGATRTLATDPSAPQARDLAESAARNAAAVAQLVLDLQRSVRNVRPAARREMIEVVPALRSALAGHNVRIDGDETLVAMADPQSFASIMTQLVASAAGRTITISVRREAAAVRLTIRPSFPDQPLDAALAGTLAEPLGAVTSGVDGSITVTLPAFALAHSGDTSRWRPGMFSGLAAS